MQSYTRLSTWTETQLVLWAPSDDPFWRVSHIQTKGYFSAYQDLIPGFALEIKLHYKNNMLV